MLKDKRINKPFDCNFTMVGALYVASFRISLKLSSSCMNRISVECSILEEIVLNDEVVDICTGILTFQDFVNQNFCGSLLSGF